MSASQWMAALLAAAVMFPVPRARAGSAPTTTVAPAPQVRLEIDVAGLGGYEGFEPEVYEAMARLALTDALRERGYEVDAAGEADTSRIGLALSWRDFDASSYEVELWVQAKQGERRALPQHLCERCSDDDLVAALEQQLDEAIDALEREPSPVGVEPVGPVAPASTEEQPPPRRLAPLAAAGIGVGAVGLAGVVVGASLASRDDRLELAPDGHRELVGTDFATPGIAVLVSGGVLLAAGITLVVVGQRRQAKQRREPRAVGWAPTVTRHGAGLGIAGRF